MKFGEFIRNDISSSKQRSLMYNLEGQMLVLESFNIQSRTTLQPTPSFYDYITTKENNFVYKTMKLQNKINDEMKDSIIKLGRLEKDDKCSIKLGWIFILAVLDGKRSLLTLKSLLNKGFDVNRHIFDIEILPTYYYFAKAVSKEKLSFTGDDKYCWNGLPVEFFCDDEFKGNPKNHLSLTQYSLLAELKRIFDAITQKNNETPKTYNEFKKTWKRKREEPRKDMQLQPLDKVEYDKPVYLIDLFCMQNKHDLVTKFIREHPKIASSSKICYLVSKDYKIALDLFRNRINPYQNFKEITPLHIAAKDGNLEMLAFFLDIGCNPNSKDENGNTPLHYAMMNGNIECFNYMTKKNYTDFKRYNFMMGNPELVNRNSEKAEDLFKEKSIEKIGDTVIILARNFYIMSEFQFARKSISYKATTDYPFKEFFEDSMEKSRVETLRTEILHDRPVLEGYIWLDAKFGFKRFKFGDKDAEESIGTIIKNRFKTIFMNSKKR